MRIINRSYKLNNHGFITLQLKTNEDLYILYQLLSIGDGIGMPVFRKIQSHARQDNKNQSQEKVLVNLKLKILQIDFAFDEKGTEINLKTITVGENDLVAKGSLQTVSVPLNQTIRLWKYKWTEEHIRILSDAENPFSKAEILIALMDNGICNFYEINNYFTQYLGQIKKSITKKKETLMQFHNRDIQDFDKLCWQHINKICNLETVKVVVVAGPGFPKQRFLQKIKNIGVNEQDNKVSKSIRDNAFKFVEVQTGSVLKQSINEILESQETMKLLQDTKCYKEAQKIGDFYKNLEINQSSCVYGEQEVFYAQHQSAIKSLLICDSVLNSSDFKLRQKIQKLVSTLKGAKGEVTVFCSNLPSGQKLMDLQGIAAILKFPIDLDLMEETEDDQEEFKKLEKEMHLTLEQEFNF